MKIIEDIQVTHFRSFLGTPKKYETKIAHLNDVNIFSGSNDSGKSNILRALNLFFNDEIAYNIPFNFERDFFAGKNEFVQKVIEISVTFNLSNEKSRDSFLPEKFIISKYYNRDGFRNYTYKFYVKEIGRDITIDSRADNNEQVKNLFISSTSTEAQRKNAEKREWNYRVKFSGFLNKNVSFEYVPAIRDKNFFTHLFGRVISQAKDSEERRLEQLRTERRKINNWKKTLKNKSEKKEFKANLSDKFWRENRLEEIEKLEKTESKFTKSIINLENEINAYASDLIDSISFLPNEFKVGKDLQDFFEGFDIGTGTDKAISLNLRGDGLQAKFIPRILDFLSNIERTNRYYIWGIEEPENSAEYSNQQELAKDIKDEYSRTKQIFLTTHSEEFLQLYDSAEVSTDNRRANLYHVKKLEKDTQNEYSQVFFYDVDEGQFELFDQKSQIDYDLGQSYLRAKYSKELKATEDKFIKETKAIERKLLEYEESFKQNTKPLLFVEDSYAQLYKIAWLKLNDLDFTKKNLEVKFNQAAPFLIYSSEGAGPLAGFLRTKNLEYFKDKKVIGLFDFDEEGKKQFNSLNNESYWKGEIQGKKDVGLYKKRSDHNCFVTLLLPIPSEHETLADITYPSFIEVENLLPQQFLIDNGFAKESITTGNTAYLAVKDKKKPGIWEAAVALDKGSFANFQQLFSTVIKIFSDTEMQK